MLGGGADAATVTQLREALLDPVDLPPVATEDETDPWDQRPGEPPGAYAAFLAYLKLGPDRSLEGAAERVGLSKSRVRHLSSRWEWGSRAASWEVEAARRQFQALAREEQAALEQQLREARNLRQLARAELLNLASRSKVDKKQVDEAVKGLSPADVISLWQTGAAAERAMKQPPARPGQSAELESRLEEVSGRVEEAKRTDRELAEVLNDVLAFLKAAGLQQGSVPEATRVLRLVLVGEPPSGAEPTIADVAGDGA